MWPALSTISTLAGSGLSKETNLTPPIMRRATRPIRIMLAAFMTTQNGQAASSLKNFLRVNAPLNAELSSSLAFWRAESHPCQA